RAPGPRAAAQRPGRAAMSGAAARFGALLRHYRTGAALSQQALAERAGLSVDAISALEAGRQGGVRLATAPRPAGAVALTGGERAGGGAGGGGGGGGGGGVSRPAARRGGPPPPRGAAPAPAGRPGDTVPSPLATPSSAPPTGRDVLPRRSGALIGRERAVATL